MKYPYLPILPSTSASKIIYLKILPYFRRINFFNHPFFSDSSIKFSGSLGNVNYETTTNITLGTWIHSSLVLTKSGGISLFLNGRKRKLSLLKEPLIGRNAEKISIIVGQWILLHEVGKAYGPIVDYDEIAIFYQELNDVAIRNIITKNFGMPLLSDFCLICKILS